MGAASGRNWRRLSVNVVCELRFEEEEGKVHQILPMTLSLFLAGVSLWSPTVIPQRKCLVGPPWKTTKSGNSTREGTRETLCFYLCL